MDMQGASHMKFEPHVTLTLPAKSGTEEFGHVVGEDVRLAYVRHRPALSRNVCVVIVGPIGAERERSYRTIVEFARSLTERGYEVLRFDHRGHGESDGAFEDATIELWGSDARRVVECLHAAFSSRVHGTNGRTVLLGVRIGALIASELFADGVGDAAVFFGSSDGQSLLRDASRRALVADSMHRNVSRSFQDAASVHPRDRGVINYAGVIGSSGIIGYSGISAGSAARVDGYLWRPRLVSEAVPHRFRKPDHTDVRPWLQVELSGSATNASKAKVRLGAEAPDSAVDEVRMDCSRTNHAVALQAPRFWESSLQLVPERCDLFDAIGSWCDQMFPAEPVG